MCKQFLEDNPEAAVIYFESESAITKDMIEERGIDSSRVVIVPVVTVQEFRHQAINILDRYLETDESERPPMMFVLDSLGMLSTTKEIEDTADGIWVVGLPEQTILITVGQEYVIDGQRINTQIDQG